MSRFVPIPTPAVATSALGSDISAAGSGDGGGGGGGAGFGSSSSVYPPAARRRRREGGGVLDFVIDSLDGDDGDNDGRLEEKDGLLDLHRSASIEITSDGVGGGGSGRSTATVPPEGVPASSAGGRVGDVIRGVVRWGRGSRSTAAGAGIGATGRGADWGDEEEEPGLTTNLGTVAWAAPEMLLGGPGGRGEYTAKVREPLGFLSRFERVGRGAATVGNASCSFE